MTTMTPSAACSRLTAGDILRFRRHFAHASASRSAEYRPTAGSTQQKDARPQAEGLSITRGRHQQCARALTSAVRLLSVDRIIHAPGVPLASRKKVSGNRRRIWPRPSTKRNTAGLPRLCRIARNTSGRRRGQSAVIASRGFVCDVDTNLSPPSADATFAWGGPPTAAARHATGEHQNELGRPAHRQRSTMADTRDRTRTPRSSAAGATVARGALRMRGRSCRRRIIFDRGLGPLRRADGRRVVDVQRLRVSRGWDRRAGIPLVIVLDHDSPAGRSGRAAAARRVMPPGFLRDIVNATPPRRRPALPPRSHGRRRGTRAHRADRRPARRTLSAHQSPYRAGPARDRGRAGVPPRAKPASPMSSATWADTTRRPMTGLR